CILFYFFFSSRRRHTRFSRDWSSDVCSSDLAEAQKALFTLLDELDNLDALEGISDGDLAIAKKRREVSRVLGVEETAMLAPGLAFWWASAGLDYYLGYSRHMNAQTVEDLRDFARLYIANQPRVIGVLAPPQLTQSVAAWLRGGKQPPP